MILCFKSSMSMMCKAPRSTGHLRVIKRVTAMCEFGYSIPPIQWNIEQIPLWYVDFPQAASIFNSWGNQVLGRRKP